MCEEAEKRQQRNRFTAHKSVNVVNLSATTVVAVGTDGTLNCLAIEAVALCSQTFVAHSITTK